MTKIVLLLSVVVILVTGCAGQGGEAVVTVSYRYASNDSDKSTRQWRAFLNALDQCHQHGYQDAAPVAPAAIVCETAAGDGCTRFRATVSYDCYGMGYQTSS